MFNKIIQEDLEFIVGHNLPWEKFENSTVLISGASGFLAAYMLETLLYLNDKYHKKIKIIALARNKEKAFKKFSHHKERKDLRFIFQDIGEPIVLGKKEHVDYIIHAASQASPKYYDKDPIGTLTANTIGTINLLRITKKEDLKGFLYLSTGGVYGKVEAKNIPMREDDYGYLDPIDVQSCYYESKRMGENICVSWFRQYKIPTKIVRISYVYGPGMDQNDKRVFPSFVADIVNKRDLLITGNGNVTRSFCYLADAIAAFFTVLLKGENGEAYNVGVEKETSILELAKILIKLFPQKHLKIVKKETGKPFGKIKNLIQRSCLDIAKIRLLGWKPVIDLNEGAKRTVLSYEDSRCHRILG